MEIGEVLYYKHGGNRDNDEFFKLYSYLKDNSVSTSHQYEGDFYASHKFTMENGEVYKCYEETDLGVFSYIERMEDEKEKEDFDTERD